MLAVAVVIEKTTKLLQKPNSTEGSGALNPSHLLFLSYLQALEKLANYGN